MQRQAKDIEIMKARRISMNMEHRKNKTFLKEMANVGGPSVQLEGKNTLSGVLEQ